MNAIVTGSRKYGAPRPDSDTDLVVLVSSADMRILRESLAACVHSESHPDYGPRSVCFKIGPLNLIATTDEAVYEAWVEGTEELGRRSLHAGVTRDEAKKLFKKLFAALKPEPKDAY